MSLARACLSAGRRSAGWVAWGTLTSPRSAVVLVVAGRQQGRPGQQLHQFVQGDYLIVEGGKASDVVAVGLAFRLLPLPADCVLFGAQLAGQAPAAVFGDHGAVDLLAAAVVPATIPAHRLRPRRGGDKTSLVTSFRSWHQEVRATSALRHHTLSRLTSGILPGWHQLRGSASRNPKFLPNR